MKNQLIIKLFLLLLPLLFSACPLTEKTDIFEDLCWNNFRCQAFVPDEDSVWIELYSGDSLIDKDSLEGHYSVLPQSNSRYEFKELLTLRIHVFCNGEWLDGVDYEFENRTDKYTIVRLEKGDLWHTGSSGVQVFTDEQLAKCPELTEYRIYVNTEHPPSFFNPS